MRPFEPIAIVGRGCVLPGALSPEALWRVVIEKRSILTPPPPGAWGLSDEAASRRRGVSGFVKGFDDVFDPRRAAVPGVDMATLDPVCAWPLHAALEAWEEAGRPRAAPDRIGVFLANLSYPSRGKADYAADLWLHGETDAPAHRYFNSGFPARLIARALGAEGPSFALDAACASSLYAMAVACARLQDRRIDAAVVGAVNAADSLLLQMGFEALNALSPTGRSRPFVAGADGLVPSEGAAALVMKRLCDVEEDDRVFGVVRGLGLSNDGRRKGLLAPDPSGQAEAIRRAYASCEVSTDKIQYLECHATGTPVGDGVEIRSAHAVFGDRPPLPVGSLKSNVGHLITAAGLASLLKMTSAFAEKTLPPSRLDGDPIDDFAGGPLSPLAEPEAWSGRKRRRAAISNFGFGGSNAHLILEEHRPRRKTQAAAKPAPAPHADEPIVICGVGMIAGADRGGAAVARRLSNQPVAPAKPMDTVGADPSKIRTPPADLAAAEAVQLAVLDVVDEALERTVRPDLDRIGVFVAFGCGAQSACWTLQARLSARLGLREDDPRLNGLKDTAAPAMTPAHVLGAMPNMPANRLNHAYDFRAMGFTVSAEQASGAAALDVAVGALRSGEIDMAVVAGADMARDTVSSHAWAAAGLEATPGDGAAALILKRRRDADAAQDPVFAEVASIRLASRTCEPSATAIENAYGTAPMAASLIEIAAAALLARGGQALDADGAAPRLAEAPARRTVSAPASDLSTGAEIDLVFAPPAPSPDPLRPPPRLFWAAAASRNALADQLSRNESGGDGPTRIALVARSGMDLSELIARAKGQLKDGEPPSGDGVFFGEGPAEGELAFVYTGSASSYPRMGRGLFGAFPEVARAMAATPKAGDIAKLLARTGLSDFEQLCAVTLLSQAQTVLLRDILGVSPDAALGLSLGETNALYAFGFWRDPSSLLDDIETLGLYDHHIGGDFDVARKAWGEALDGWTNWRVYAPIDRVGSALREAPHAEMTIIYSPEDCVIGGPPAQCRQVVDALGPGAGVAMQQNLVVHARAMKPFEDAWRHLHTRPTSSKPSVRLYSNAFNAAYKPTKTKAAEALTRQAVSAIDFPKTVEQAYADGVRTFVEIGPRDTLSQGVGKILAGRPHLAVAADRVERSDLGQIAHLAAALFADGRKIAIDTVVERLEIARTNALAPRPPYPFSKQAVAPPPAVRQVGRPPGPGRPSAMPPAPRLPPPAHPSHDGRRRPSPETAPFPPPPWGERRTPPEKVVSGRQALPKRTPAGPRFDRDAIERATTGPISALFGPAFDVQDGYDRQVRLPTPPLLLVDRITGIDAEAGVEGKGVIWTETDLVADAWYTADGRIRPGPLIECGQADLSLISWMGADFRNRGDRVYRLLGCDITFHDALPKAGETLRFQIEITGHASLSGVRMFFFQYDCRADGDRLVFSVRNGQAGFFTDAELADGKGVAWDPTKDPAPTQTPRPFTALNASKKTLFSADDVAAFRAGDAYACFGDGFELCAAHSRPPRTADGDLALFERVDAFDPAGGPWGRGYLKAVAPTPAEAWFYRGHFHNDPCMPGTLMAEAAVQALEFYAAAIGLTVERDGFVFEPVPGETATFACRGQVAPDGPHEIVYEVFIDEVVDGDTPEIYAALLATCDGKKVFHVKRFSLRLRRDWPAERPRSAAVMVGPENESRGSEDAMLECANGAPSAAFGEMYAPFDVQGRAPRLPQPPYHFLSRVVDVTTRPNAPEIGARVTSEYDIPENAWYFDLNPNGAMPFAVLSEVLLQPCGWLASHGGFALRGGERFRNLNGDGRVLRAVRPTDRGVRLDSTLTKVSKAGPMTIVFFDVDAKTYAGDPVMTLETSFGFFTADALARQAGLRSTEAHSAMLSAAPKPLKRSALGPHLMGARMKLHDEIDHFDPNGGAAGLGLIRGRQTIDPYAWYFKAHFYQDPVQPGSLGLHAMTELLVAAAVAKGLAEDIENPLVETLAVGEPIKWAYRGQVTPERKEVVTAVEIIGVRVEKDAVLVSGRGSLWADGLRIYEIDAFSVRIRRRTDG